MNYLLLFLFFFASISLGTRIIEWVAGVSSRFVWVVASALMGFFVSVWLTYLFVILTHSYEVALLLVIFFGLFLFKKKLFFSYWRISAWDMIALLASIGISSWTMGKTFHFGPQELLVGANEVFDMGHALSVIRSFSFGKNVPYMSPFIAGETHVYHFLFYFWAGILERFGIPIVYALNIPSVIAFSGLLMVAYELAKYFFSSVIAGFLAMYLTLTHSTLTFWYFLKKQPLSSVWRNATYFFAGPYDGSNISIFWTLNVFVNQRHLVFAMATTLMLFFMAIQKKVQPLLLGFLAGIMVWWHMTLSIAVITLIGMLFLFQKKYIQCVTFMFAAIFVTVIQIIPWFIRLPEIRQYEGQLALFYYFLSDNFGSLLQYWWMNLGVALLTIPIGFFLLPVFKRIYILPFGVLFIIVNVVRFGSDIAENHKFLNLIFVVGSILSAGCVAWVFQKSKSIAIGIAILLSASGIIDLMVIKNDFQYPVVDVTSSSFMRWIRDDTRPDDIFLSYQEIFDPVTFAGRKTYFGFFGAKAYPDRSEIVKLIYETTNITAVHENNIDYIVVPKWKKDDFHYVIDERYLRSVLTIAYEDDRHVVFAKQ